MTDNKLKIFCSILLIGSIFFVIYNLVSLDFDYPNSSNVSGNVTGLLTSMSMVLLLIHFNNKNKTLSNYNGS